MILDKVKAPVSVIIPCFRCANTIARAVDSVYRQTLIPTEVILIDDASGDETLAMLLQIQSLHIGWVKILQFETNQGVANARNAGWDIATQPYIAFLDADDEWCVDKIGIQYQYMLANNDVFITGHKYIISDKLNGDFNSCATIINTQIRPISLLFKNCFPTSSVMLINIDYFRFSIGKRYAEDLYLWQQIAFSGYSVVRIEVPLVYYFKELYGKGGLSAKLWQMEKGELSNIMELKKSNTIGLYLFMLAIIFSFAKFLKRMVLSRV
jgi:glycosyltransferase involved in cell wall biosynthesis